MSTSSQALQELASVTNVMGNNVTAIDVTGAKAGGKQRIVMHGIQHAVSGQRLFMPGDEMTAYLRSGAAYVAALRPLGYQEEQLTQKIIDLNWWLNRSNAIESNLLNAKSLENSAQGKRSTDVATETTLAQALGFSQECGETNAFEVLNRCIARNAQLYVKLTREMERAREKRLKTAEDAFVLDDCQIYRWYRDQIRIRETPAVEEAPALRHAAAA